MTRKSFAIMIGSLAIISLTACSTTPTTPTTPVAAQGVRIIRATGHGTVRHDAGLNPSQMRLMAQRASKLDAYRQLTEAVYGTKLYGSNSVKDMVVSSDIFKTYVTGFITGARQVSSVPMEDPNTYETVLELKLDQQFYEACRIAFGQSTQNACTESNGDCRFEDRYFYISR